MTSTELTIRQFNGTDIAHRRSDGYMDATAMCKANGKIWHEYRRAASTQPFLDELGSVTGLSLDDLIQTIQGGNAEKQGTWVHPYIAVNLGQWCSPAFAVKVSSWVIERHTAQPRRIEPPMSGNAIRMFARDMSKLYGPAVAAEMLRDLGVNVPEVQVTQFAQMSSGASARTVSYRLGITHEERILDVIKEAGDAGITKSGMQEKTQTIAVDDRNIILRELVESGLVSMKQNPHGWAILYFANSEQNY